MINDEVSQWRRSDAPLEAWPVEALRAEIEQLRAENARLREIAEAVVDKFNPPFTCDPCPWCYADQDYEPHAPDCIITELRKLTGRAAGKEEGAP